MTCQSNSQEQLVSVFRLASFLQHFFKTTSLKICCTVVCEEMTTTKCGPCFSENHLCLVIRPRTVCTTQVHYLKSVAVMQKGVWLMIRHFTERFFKWGEPAALRGRCTSAVSKQGVSSREACVSWL